MWADTEITRRFGIRYPIIQGPFGGGLSSARLAAIVANSGGLGSYGANSLQPSQIKDIGAEIRVQTSNPFAINLWVNPPTEPTLSQEAFERAFACLAPYYRELGLDVPTLPVRFGQEYDKQVEAVLAVKPRVFSFVFGIPSEDVLRECRARGILTVGTATTVDEARALDDADVDGIVATGFEAGGHRGAFLRSAEDSLNGTLALVPQVVDAVKAPVIAAGGIADARGIVAALALGAQAVQIGTAFVACEESGAPRVHRDRLLTDEAQDTRLSAVFSGRLARSIRNRFMDEMTAHQATLPPYPILNWFTANMRKAAIAQGRDDLISLQAGLAAPLVRQRNAATLMEELVRETSHVIARLSR
jgi:nitronate monooxygenase